MSYLDNFFKIFEKRNELKSNKLVLFDFRLILFDFKLILSDFKLVLSSLFYIFFGLFIVFSLVSFNSVEVNAFSNLTLNNIGVRGINETNQEFTPYLTVILLSEFDDVVNGSYCRYCNDDDWLGTNYCLSEDNWSSWKVCSNNIFWELSDFDNNNIAEMKYVFIVEFHMLGGLVFNVQKHEGAIGKWYEYKFKQRIGE